ncbi:MAG TPA: carboxypeptidase-like regulatory domain-containing protein, partial [Rhodothermales bacterium]|nr:carboxypeptidase-like regulatory domain-containing protein [Rhodothermales bacterium]
MPPVDAQIVRGRVVDASSGQPIPGVNVFIAHTTLGAATDGAGHYVISGVPFGPNEVAASSLGYLPVSRQITVGQEEITVDFDLEPVTYELTGLEVAAERDREWERLFELFEEQFLGNTPNAGSTAIFNPYILDLKREEGLLTARASEPLVIENSALGYRIKFILRNFSFHERTNELRLEGVPFFEDLPGDDPTRQRRREEAFLGSMRHMLWATIRGRLSEEGFRIHRRSLDRIPPRDDWTRFEPAVTGLTGGDIVSETGIQGVYSLRFDGHLQVTYQRKSRPFPFGLGLGPSTQVSWLKLQDFRALVQDDGTTYPDTPVIVAGYMSIHRLAELLPRDHVLQLERTLLEGPKREVVRLPGETAFPQEPGLIHPAESRAAEPAVAAMKERKWLRAVDLLDAILKHNPEDLEARYYRAIAHREIAKFRAVLHFQYYGRGLDDFAFLFARDSTYRDALYQFALFSRVEPMLLTNQIRVELEDALLLAHKQARLRPDVGGHEYHLFTLYRRFINNRNAAAALKWLD